MDDVAAFEEYLHNAPCFKNNRIIPYVYAPEPRKSGTPWMLAVHLGSVGVVEALLKYQDYNDGIFREGWDRVKPMKGESDRQVMRRAIEQRQIEVVRLMIGRPEMTNDEAEECEYSPLLFACRQLRWYQEHQATLDAWVDGLEAIIGLLLDSRANARDEYRKKASRGRPPLLRRLIEEGADVNARIAMYDSTGDRDTTLLHIASRYHNVAAVRFLLDERPEGPAMARVRDSRGFLPLPLAAMGSYPGFYEREGRLDDADVAHHAVETIKALLPYNDVDERATDGMTALSLAARYCQQPGARFSPSCYDPVVQLLLDHGANPCDAGADYGDTPLHSAVRSGDRIGAVRLLLLHGARPDVQNHDGDTPFHVAARSCRIRPSSTRPSRQDEWEGFRRREHEKQQEVMRLLLNALGGDGHKNDILDQANHEGETPRRIAQLRAAESERAEKIALRSGRAGEIEGW
ncbi:ankyrin repeat-containing domain protein [Apiospora marii]|uniref:ankyrin repeat-containing domain protein n=1 Tax=Apiospora marii TaxID=335849 RepID=UPI00312D9C58